MALSNRFVIEDAEGNKFYPHSFAEVVHTNDGSNVEEKLQALDTKLGSINITWADIEGKPDTFTPETHTHTSSEISGLPTSLPANGGNADTVDGKHATDFATSTHTHTFPVTSVAGKTGAVTLTKADVGLGNVPNYGASTSVTSTSTTTLATSSAVKQAYDLANSAFQSASSGKTAIANAITAKGVTASGTETHAQLATKIGQLNVKTDAQLGTELTNILSAVKLVANGLASSSRAPAIAYFARMYAMSNMKRVATTTIASATISTTITIDQKFAIVISKRSHVNYTVTGGYFWNSICNTAETVTDGYYVSIFGCQTGNTTATITVTNHVNASNEILSIYVPK